MKVAYFTPSSFRTVNAGALRNVGLAKALVEAGHEVTIISGDHVLDEMSPEWNGSTLGSGTHILPGGRSRGRSSQVVSRLFRYLGGPTSGLARNMAIVNPDIVILYNADPVALLRLRHSARSRKLKFIVDVTEWLNPADLPGGKFSPFAILHEVTMRGLAWRRGGFLAISGPMAARMGRRSSNTLVVPPIFDIDCPALDLPSTDRIRLVTTGTDLRSRGKDIVGLSLIVNALAEVDPDGDKFHLDVVGAYSDQTKVFVDQRLSSSAFTMHGRLSWHETLSVVHRAAFSVVLRDPSDRRSHLGFPSKVPESLLVGTPVLANAFSDLADHVEDGVNGVLLAQPTLAGLVSALGSLPLEIDRGAVCTSAQARYTPAVWSRKLSDFIGGNL